jgi:hypothetical protein
MGSKPKRLHLAPIETPDDSSQSSSSDDDNDNDDVSLGDASEERSDGDSEDGLGESSDVEIEASGADGNAPLAHPEIQVEFEARTPEETDFAGIKRFLLKLFTKSNKIDFTGDLIGADQIESNVFFALKSLEKEDCN